MSLRYRENSTVERSVIEIPISFIEWLNLSLADLYVMEFSLQLKNFEFPIFYQYRIVESLRVVSSYSL
jgi:hypothetical protein